MLNLFLRWIAYTLAIIFVAWIIPGISVENFLSAMLVCVILALINTFIKPMVQIISLPITILTLGLFALVINALLLMLAGVIAPGFEVDGFLSAFLGSILLSLFGMGIDRIGEKNPL
ncbi:phage holin family protein [bacterium]|nr:phage holin family protein [bacterium]